MRAFIKHSNRGLVSSKIILGLCVICGLAYGTAYLGKSTEIAAAAAFVGTFSFVVSAWMSYHGHSLIMRAYSVWLDAIGRQLDLNRARLNELIPETASRSGNNVRRRPVVAHLLKVSLALTPGALSATITCAMMTILWAQIDDASTVTFVIALAFCSISVVATVGGQCLYLSYLHWRVASLGRQLERHAAIVQTPEQALEPEVRRIDLFGDGIALSTRVGRYLVGGGAAPSR